MKDVAKNTSTGNSNAMAASSPSTKKSNRMASSNSSYIPILSNKNNRIPGPNNKKETQAKSSRVISEKRGTNNNPTSTLDAEKLVEESYQQNMSNSLTSP